MNRSQLLPLLLFSVFAAVQTESRAMADKYADPYVNYELLCEHADALQGISAEMKDCLRDQFRYSHYYGKMISRTARIKSAARRLHRRGLSHDQCDWRNEISDLSYLVGELNELFDRAVYRSRTGYDRPICGTAIRTMRGLIAKAHHHVRGLNRSLRRIEHQHHAPNIYHRPAPHYSSTPSGIGYGVYRSGNRNSHLGNQYYTPSRHTQQRQYYTGAQQGLYGPRGFAGVDFDRQGVSLNVGGLRFNLNK